MEPLEDTVWDVIICGTGLQQSLLALALSRSDKKILHLDPNQYYGGQDAALSLSEAEEWATLHAGSDPNSLFTAATTTKSEGLGALSSRAYSLALAPQLVYASSGLLAQLVSSRAYRQLEFLAVGAFFVFQPASTSDAASSSTPTLARIPSTREDVFSASAVPARAKRQLMKFLKFVLDYDADAQAPLWRPHARAPLAAFLGSAFGLSEELRAYVLALTLSPDARVSVEDGLPAVRRHLTSMGVLGPGFAAVYPKWGGTSEIAQVACRAGAVGGAVYMLGTGIEDVEAAGGGEEEMRVRLTSGVVVKAKALVRAGEEAHGDGQRVARLVAVVGSPLSQLFEAVVEGAPTPGVAVVAFPPGSAGWGNDDGSQNPVYAFAHSSDTGECPSGQSVLYFSTSRTPTSRAILESILASFLESLDAGPVPIHFQLYYEQAVPTTASEKDGRVFEYSSASPSLTFDDATLGPVQEAWKLVMGAVTEQEEAEYMKFRDREGVGEDDGIYD